MYDAKSAIAPLLTPANRIASDKQKRRSSTEACACQRSHIQSNAAKSEPRAKHEGRLDLAKTRERAISRATANAGSHPSANGDRPPTAIQDSSPIAPPHHRLGQPARTPRRACVSQR
jgi:hypothetical protein